MRIIDRPHFSAEWLSVPPGGRFVMDAGRPHELVAAAGEGRLEAEGNSAELQRSATSWTEFAKTRRCYGAVIHGATEGYALSCTGDEALVVLAAWGRQE